MFMCIYMYVCVHAYVCMYITVLAEIDACETCVHIILGGGRGGGRQECMVV